MNNRIIKFRIWNPVIKEHLYPEGQGELAIGVRGGIFSLWSKDNNFTGWILQQFTGILDINKKEIYEGDIIKFIKSKSNNYSIFYENGAFLFKVDDGSVLPLYFADKKSIEVVGNTLENPELLNNK